MVYKFFDRKIASLAQSATLATRDKYSSNTNKGTGFNSGTVSENAELTK